MKIDSYPTLRRQVHQTLLIGQKQIEQAKVQTYWRTGKLINDHIQKHGSRNRHYGGGVVSRLAQDLGVSERVLYQCLQFARTFKILKPASKSLPEGLTWTHYAKLATVPDESTRRELMRRAEQGGWSKRELQLKINQEVRADENGTKGTPPHPFPKLLPKRGTLYTYRLVPARSAAQQAESPLWLDLGFQATRSAAPAKDRKVGEIVESRKQDGLCRIVESGRGEGDLFTYRAGVEKVVDGDTLRVEIDLGFGISLREYLRLRGIDAPEIGTPEGRKAKAFVERALEKSRAVVLTSTRDDKYGRYLADVFYDERGSEAYLNQRLLDEGLAERYEGGSRGE